MVSLTVHLLALGNTAILPICYIHVRLTPTICSPQLMVEVILLSQNPQVVLTPLRYACFNYAL